MSVKHAAAGALVGVIVVKGIPAPFITAGVACALLYMLLRFLVRVARGAVQRIRAIDWLNLTGRPSSGRISTLEQELATAHSQVIELRATHAELSDKLRMAQECVADLKIELRNAKEDILITSSGLRRSPEATDPLYGRVGLCEGAPSWLVVDARRSYRRKLHPDCYPAQAKELAHKCFVEAELVFDRIYDERGLRA
jgi:hypothetical protein